MVHSQPGSQRFAFMLAQIGYKRSVCSIHLTFLYMENCLTVLLS